mgnify:CR=1 FL=1
MPPKARITKEMIIEEAFQIVRSEGADKLTVRHIAEKLKCSTQPILYYFATIEEIKVAVYRRADEYHNDYLQNMERDYGDPMLGIGMNYIQFAREEKNLFRLLFQSNEFAGANLLDLLETEDLVPIMHLMEQELEATSKEVREIFQTLFIFVHGYASMFANNEMKYEEEQVVRALTKVFYGAIYAAKEVKDEEAI